MTERRKLICLDFDGVLHSYTSGWQGAANIPDPPTDGALQWLCEALVRFDVAIFSSRSHQEGGRKAMRQWLYEHLLDALAREGFDDGDPVLIAIAKLGYEERLMKDVAREIANRIDFPDHKPPAHVSIDDRAFQFNGHWDHHDLDAIDSFEPWNKRGT